MDSTQSPPKWINVNFISKALNIAEPKDIDSITVNNANKDGLGYMGKLYRVFVQTKKQGDAEFEPTTALILKCAQESGLITDMGNELGVFSRESFVYDIIPQLDEALRSVEGDQFHPLAPKCFNHGKEPTEYIVLEDLVALDFRLADAGKPLDLEFCSLVLKNYARMHAASAFLFSRQPEYRERLRRNPFVEVPENDFIILFYKNVCHAAGNALRNLPGYEEYAEKLFNLHQKLIPKAKESAIRKMAETKLVVMNHGDCWKNNFMFKYAEQGLQEMRIIDFQVSYAGNPANDLVYFLYANASLEVHRDHLDTLLAEYHSTLVATLRALGMDDVADEYPLEQLKKDMDDLTSVGVFCMLMSSFTLTSEKLGAEFAAAFSNPNCDNDVINKSYDNPYSVPYLKYVIPIFDKKGVL